MAYTDTGSASAAQDFDLALYYPEGPADPMSKLQLWVSDGADEQERQLMRTVSHIAAQLCDAELTAQKLDALFDAERSHTEYTVFTDDIGAFWDWDYYADSFGQLKDDSLETVYCRSGQITHSITGYAATGEEWYELAFDPALYAEQEQTMPTVAQLEDGMNAYFQENGIPLQCAFRSTDSHDNYTNVGGVPVMNFGTVDWSGNLWFTDWEIADFPYPEYELADFEPQTQEYDRAMVLLSLNHSLSIELDSKGGDHASPVSNVSCWGSAVELTELVTQAAIAAWDSAMGSDDMAALYEQASQDKLNNLETEEYRVQFQQEDQYLRFSAEYQPARFLLQEDYEPQPQEWSYQMSSPILNDGWFEHYIQPTDPRCYKAIMEASSDSFHPFSCLLSDYMESWGLLEGLNGSNMSVAEGDYLRDSPYELASFQMFNYGSGEWNYLNPMLFGGFALELEGFADEAQYYNNRQMYAVYYNEAEDALPYAQLPYRAAVGLAQLMDESMTLQQIVTLLAKDGEPDLQLGNWSVYYENTGEVVHVVCKNTATKQTIYHVLPQKLIDTYFKDLTSFVQFAVGEYETLTYPGMPSEYGRKSILYYPDMGYYTTEWSLPSMRGQE